MRGPPPGASVFGENYENGSTRAAAGCGQRLRIDRTLGLHESVELQVFMNSTSSNKM